MPKLSIVTPCYNSAAFVAETVASVRAQTFQDWEHIIVDDGSTDNSAEIVQALTGSDTRLKLIRQPNGGVCQARNAGFSHTAPNSKYVYFLDADDCLVPEMLAVIVNHLDQHPAAGLACCSYVYIDDEGRTMFTPTTPRCVPCGAGLRRLVPHEALTPFVSILCGAPVLASLSVLRRSVYEASPRWDENFGQHHEEIDLFLHIALSSEVHYVPSVLYHYRQHPAQSTKHAESFHAQQQKLDSKWSHKRGLTATQQAVVEKALRFRDGRMTPYTGVLAGTRHLRRGELVQAARFYGGAIKRYARSFLPHRPPRTGNMTGTADHV